MVQGDFEGASAGACRSAERHCVVIVQARQSILDRDLERALQTHGLGPLVAVDVGKWGILSEQVQRAAAVIFASDASSSIQGLRDLALVRQSQPQLPLFCCVDASASGNHRIARLARAGADGIFVVDGGESPAEVAGVIARAAAHVLPAAFVQELVERVPSDVRQLVSWSLRSSWHRLPAGEIANFFGEDRATIWRQLHRAEAPSIRTITKLCRAAHVCVELDRTHHTEDVIAHRLDFGGDNAVRMLVRRAFGDSVSNVRGAALSRLIEKWRGAFARKPNH